MAMVCCARHGAPMDVRHDYAMSNEENIQLSGWGAGDNNLGTEREGASIMTDLDFQLQP